MNERQEPSKATQKVQRKLTPFLCKEMLYPYIMGTLGEDCRREMDQFLKIDEDSARELERMKKAINYCHQLGGIEIEEKLLHRIKSVQGESLDLLGYLSFRKWPEPVKYLVEGLLIAIVTFVLVAFAPWDKVTKWWEDAKTSRPE